MSDRQIDSSNPNTRKDAAENRSSVAGRIAGAARQPVGEIVGDQALHDQGRRQRAGDDEGPTDRGGRNPFDKLNHLT